MNEYRADLHVHTVLSPCGDLEMSPAAIIDSAVRKKLDMIGICDHNSTRQVALTAMLGRERGIYVLMGVEINTAEEVHCLAFFENTARLDEFQLYLDTYLPDIKNDPEQFGYQVVVDREEKIVFEEKRLLFNAIGQSVEETGEKVHSLGGIFIPAHIDRPKNGLLSQLGFLPDGLNVDALEISGRTRISDYLSLHPELHGWTVITGSDAHFLFDIGSVSTLFRMQSMNFSEVKLALQNRDGREVFAV